MRVRLAFGRTGLEADLPTGFEYRVLEARSATALNDPVEAIEHALDEPIGTPPLVELARGRRSAGIVVCDITRPAPNRFTLPPLLDRLHAAGLARESIRIFIATGLHRPATDAELEEILGSDIVSRYPVFNHDARRLELHRYLGKTPRGVPIYIDERFLATDLHITLGFIEPHLMLGYSGGRKLIAPGLAGQDTIKALHSPQFMRDPRAVEGSIEGNPLHEELLEIASRAGHDFILDVALSRERRIAGVFAGHPVEAHRRGVEFVSQVMLERLDAPVDAVITTGAGYPLDLTFYQSIKGITAAAHIVRQGGRILLVAACEEGAGSPEFRQLLKQWFEPEAFLNAIVGREVIVDQWQLEKLALVARKVALYFYVPGLPAEYQTHLWGPTFSSIQEAITAFTAGLPAGSQIAVIPEGPYVLAKVTAPATPGCGAT